LVIRFSNEYTAALFHNWIHEPIFFEHLFSSVEKITVGIDHFEITYFPKIVEFIRHFVLKKKIDKGYVLFSSLKGIAFNLRGQNVALE